MPLALLFTLLQVDEGNRHVPPVQDFLRIVMDALLNGSGFRNNTCYMDFGTRIPKSRPCVILLPVLRTLQLFASMLSTASPGESLQILLLLYIYNHQEPKKTQKPLPNPYGLKLGPHTIFHQYGIWTINSFTCRVVLEDQPRRKRSALLATPNLEL